MIRRFNPLVIRLSSAIALVFSSIFVDTDEALPLIKIIIIANAISGLFAGPIGEYIVFRYGVPSKKVFLALISFALLLMPVGFGSVYSQTILLSIFSILLQIDRHYLVKHLFPINVFTSCLKFMAIAVAPIQYYGFIVSSSLSIGILIILIRLEKRDHYKVQDIQPKNAIVFALAWYTLSLIDILYISLFSLGLDAFYVSYLMTMKILEASAISLTFISWGNVRLSSELDKAKLGGIIRRRAIFQALIIVCLLMLTNNARLFGYITQAGEPLPLPISLLLGIGYLSNVFGGTVQVLMIRRKTEYFGFITFGSLIFVFLLSSLLNEQLGLYGPAFVNALGYFVFNLVVYRMYASRSGSLQSE